MLPESKHSARSALNRSIGEVATDLRLALAAEVVNDTDLKGFSTSSDKELGRAF